MRIGQSTDHLSDHNQLLTLAVLSLPLRRHNGDVRRFDGAGVRHGDVDVDGLQAIWPRADNGANPIGSSAKNEGLKVSMIFVLAFSQGPAFGAEGVLLPGSTTRTNRPHAFDAARSRRT